jgi:hypothetical protein
VFLLIGTESGTYAVVWSTIELNVAIICASLLVMKPLFAKWIPSMVSEQPMTASEDRRVMRQLTGLILLTGDVDDEEKAAEPAQVRRDAGVAGLDAGGSGDQGVPARSEDIRIPGSSWSTDSSSR